MDPKESFNLMSAPAVRCKAISKSSRKQCQNWAIKGGATCRVHGGNAPQVKAKAVVRAEVMSWGLGDATVDPGEVLQGSSLSQLPEQSITPDCYKKPSRQQSD
jgi:hypothetical protein